MKKGPNSHPLGRTENCFRQIQSLQEGPGLIPCNDWKSGLQKPFVFLPGIDASQHLPGNASLIRRRRRIAVWTDGPACGIIKYITTGSAPWRSLTAQGKESL